MNKETVGLVVSLGLLFVAYFWANHYFAPPPAPAPAVVAATAVATVGALPVTPVEAPTLSNPVSEVAPASPADLALKADRLELDFVQRGGCIGSAVLPRYRAAVKSDAPVSVFTNHQVCKAFGFKIGDLDLRELPAKVTRISERKIELAQVSGGWELVRRFELTDGYRGLMTVELRNLSNAEQQTTVRFDLGARSESDGAGGMFSGHPLEGHNVAFLNDDKVERAHVTFSSTPEAHSVLQAQGVHPKWMASGSMYFVNAVMPQSSETLNIDVRQVGAIISKDAQSPRDQVVVEAWVESPAKLAPGAQKSWSYDLYIGPKYKRELDKISGKDLAKVVDFGFFSVIAWPLFYALDFIHMVVRNWGIAIIVLTAFVKILLYPLARKSYVSMKKMQKIQPELKALQEKYKDDKQKLNQETMALMSQRGANPLSGCLPMLPQLPIFFGLYSVFQQTFELRQAPFFFWIQDLSSKDPFYVLPALIAALYFVQQKMTPMAPGMDPVQQKMMQVLPFVFSLMMITFPSGLALYIVTNTVLSIAQQWYMMKKFKDV